MPFSQSSQISTIVQFGEALHPSSLLDVGAGMGQYGFLFRTTLENVGMFDLEAGTWRPKNQWRITIDGIEGFKEYVTGVHNFAYNQIIIGEARECLSRIPNGAYEFVIAIDILEHFWKEDGWLVLDELKRVSSRAVLVSTPKEFHAQDIAANPLENHRSVWSDAELAQAGYNQVLPNAESWVVVCAR